MTARWILLPFASVAAWFFAALIGLLLLAGAESLCPRDQMVSGMCIAPWWRYVETGIFCGSIALSAVFAVAAAFFIAPIARAQVAWCCFGVGSGIALWMAWGTSAWAEFVSALVAGSLAAFLLSRSRFAITGLIKHDP